jgi:hypothetical protein
MISGRPQKLKPVQPGTALREALKEVSKVRLEQTIYAEHPRLRKFIPQLEGEKATQTTEALRRVWGCDDSSASNLADELAQIGIFERTSRKRRIEYRAPFLYRDALRLVQGKADS